MSSKNKGGGGKGSKKDGVGGGVVCAHCKKVGELGTMKRCGRCRRACYCSVECQKLHWGKGGHKKVCRNEGSSGASSDGVPDSSGGVDAPLQHPCPVCLDNEDDAGDMGMCTSCGQLFCGSCKTSCQARGMTSCPTCRAVAAASDKEEVRQLRQLLARQSGRHTPVAQDLLGMCYVYGAGVAQNYAKAVRLFRLAADQGRARAQCNLGVSYQNGTAGVVQNAAEAVRWYRLAADQGYANAQCNLGICYGNGTGVPQNEAEAVRWYRLAADQGYADAQSNLGVCYGNGTGVAQDAAEAVRWYRLAADQAHASAQCNLGACYGNGTGVTQDEAEAVRWYRLAAAQGCEPALGVITELGLSSSPSQKFTLYLCCALIDEYSHDNACLSHLGLTRWSPCKNKGGGGKGSKKDGVGGGLVCVYCKKVGDLDTMKRRGRCRRVCYCSVECQKLHWGKGGHKNVCRKEGSSGDRSDGAGISGVFCLL